MTGDELARLHRWEDSGATWRVIVRTPEGERSSVIAYRRVLPVPAGQARV